VEMMTHSRVATFCLSSGIAEYYPTSPECTCPHVFLRST
jgi:hypothetical protein